MPSTSDEFILVFSHVLKTGAAPLGAVRLLPGARCVIGRGVDCDIIIKSSTMSRKHAAVTSRDGSFVIEDLGSSGGTFATSRRQRLRRPEPFASGDSFMLGTEELRIEIVDRWQLQDRDVVTLSENVLPILRR